MQRLTGADGFHLYEEDRVQHMHTIKIAIVDPSTADEPITFEGVKKGMAAGMAHIPPFRWRLMTVPFRIGHPWWLERPEIDVNYHLRRSAVPSPGGQTEFDEVVSQIASVPLEREHPLWQLWFVEGLEHGHVAYVLKIHHSLADGVASARLLMGAFQPDPTARLGPWPTDAIPRDPTPPRAALFRRAVTDLLSMVAASPALLRRTVAVIVAALGRKRAGIEPVAAFTAPATRFDKDLTPQRLYVNATVPLGDLRAVKRAFGCTINDVFIAITGGAVRQYLEARGELPDRSLNASMPASIRRPDEIDDYGNRVANLTATLGTDITDPVERLAAVAKSTAAAKASLAQRDQRFSWDWQRLYWFWRAWSVVLPRAVYRMTGEPAFSAILSNVPGPRETLYSDGAMLVGVQSMGPVIERMGLNATAWSYCDDFSIGVVACRDRVPDLRDLVDRIPAELELLVIAAQGVTGRTVG